MHIYNGIIYGMSKHTKKHVSVEQEILDKELARLQYLYHMQRNMNHHQQRQQRRKQNPAVHRRGRSYNDLDSQFSRVNIHPPRAVVANNATLQ